ncbi:MAG: sigma-54 dependent transcriptional regulator [Methylococcales bacterium]|nr:sigma-54 dependent transcriptional regulator [Methylococcales bacterium]
MNSFDILITEDDPALREALCDNLELEGYQVSAARDGIDALAKLKQHIPKLLLSDVKMPGLDGFGLLEQVKARYPSLPVVLMTAYGTVPKAVQAMQEGAADFLVKPFNADCLNEKIARYLSQQSTPNQATDAKMRSVYQLLDKVAVTDATVLLQGESGTGKEVLARYLHQQSPRHDHAFIAVNCAAIPDNMLEAMLFGHEKGAFTGAIQAVPGKFEQAQGGTLLLDEIGEMDLNLQAKLLRVIQEKEVERLGGQKKISLNVRFLAATNKNLKEKVAQGEFREDLYYRLCVFPVSVPPLRERPGDILPLAELLLAKHLPPGTETPKLTSAAQSRLLAYPWPGNVRELDNVLQRALILRTDPHIDSAQIVFDSPDYDARPLAETPATTTASAQAPGAVLHQQVRMTEADMILETLKQTSGSRKLTAERLGISPRTLRYKLARMKEDGLHIPD